MNNITINNIFKSTIIIALSIIPFLPLYVANGMFFPFITGKAFAFRVIIEIVFALWLILILREKGTAIVGTEKSVLPRINWITISVTIFAFVALIADLLGLNILRSIWSNFERMEGWITIIHLWAYFIVLSSIFGTGEEAKKNWYRFFNVVLVAGAITATYGLFQFFDWAATHQGSRVDASLGNSAYMAIYMLINAFLAGYMAILTYTKNLGKGSIKGLFYLYSFGAVFFSFIMFQTATRGTIIGWTVAIIISCIIYAIFGREKNGQSNISRVIAIGFVGLVFLSGVLLFANKEAKWIKDNEVLGRITSISISDTRTQARGFIWPMAVKGIFESPKSAVIGIGQENFNYIFNSHYEPKMYAHEQWFDRAHSVFLDWLVAGGLLGLASYFLLYLISFVYIYKSNLSLGQKSILAGLLVGYGIHNVFVFDNQTSYIMFFTFLAFVFSLRPNKLCSWFKNYEKAQSEDSITIRDYVFTPIIIIALGTSLYFINIRPIQANLRLIDSLVACSNPQTTSVETFKKALKLNETMADQEIREQLLTCASNVIRNQQTTQEQKIEFYNLAKEEVENQIKATPNDARIYVIAGSFFNSVMDYGSATPLLEKAIELSPNKQSIIYDLAENYVNIGKKKEAMDIMEKAYLSAPENLQAKVSYIATLIIAGEDAKARKLFADDLSIFNDRKIINAYVVARQYDRAIETYKNLIKANPEDQGLYSSLAYVYMLNKQDYLAIDTLKNMSIKFPLAKTEIENIIKQIQEGKVKLQ